MGGCSAPDAGHRGELDGCISMLSIAHYRCLYAGHEGACYDRLSRDAGMGGCSAPDAGHLVKLLQSSHSRTLATRHTPDRDTLAHGGVVMGFGHHVYHTTDPRNSMLRAVAEELHNPRLELAVKV